MKGLLCWGVLGVERGSIVRCAGRVVLGVLKVEKGS